MHRHLSPEDPDAARAERPGSVHQSAHQNAVRREQIWQGIGLPALEGLVGGKRVPDLLDFAGEAQHMLPGNHRGHLLQVKGLFSMASEPGWTGDGCCGATAASWTHRPPPNGVPSIR